MGGARAFCGTAIFLRFDGVLMLGSGKLLGHFLENSKMSAGTSAKAENATMRLSKEMRADKCCQGYPAEERDHRAS